MTAMFRTALAVSFAVLLASCGVKQSMEDATAEIAQFHTRYGNEDYKAICTDVKDFIGGTFCFPFCSVHVERNRC